MDSGWLRPTLRRGSEGGAVRGGTVRRSGQCDAVGINLGCFPKIGMRVAGAQGAGVPSHANLGVAAEVDGFRV